MATLLQEPRSIPVDAKGAPYAGAKRYVYQAGTTTPLTVYTDSALTTAHAFPQVADANGVFAPAYLPGTVTSYRRRLTNSADVLISDVDNISTGVQPRSELGAVLSPRTDAEIAASVTPTDYGYPAGDARRYGTTDYTRLRDVFAQFAAGGDPVILEQGKEYDCGTQSGSAVLFPIDDVVGGRIEGNGAKIKIQTSDTSAPIALQFNDCRHIIVNKLRGNDEGYSQANQSGLVMFDVRATGATDENIGDITFNDCEIDGGVMLLRVAGNATGQVSTNTANRIRNIRVRGGRASRVFYGVNLQNHGDDCEIDITADDLHRTVLAYGVTGLKFDAYIKNPRGGFAQILLKSYGRDTESVKGRAYFETSASSYECLTLEFENDTQTQTIRDIDIELSCHNAVATAKPVTFRAFDSSLVARTTTDNRWDNIRLSGDWTGFTTPFTFTTRPTTEGKIVLSPSLAGQLSPRVNHSGFVICPDALTEIRMANADLTANSITIPCTRYDGNAFALRCQVYAQDIAASVGTANQTFSDDLLLAYNQAGGNVTINSRTNIATATQGTASTVGYSTSGENILVTFTAYSNSDAIARVVTQHVRAFVS